MTGNIRYTTGRAAFTDEEADVLAAARLRAVDCMPYLATLLFEVRIVRAVNLGTFAVDRHWRLYIDPERLTSWGAIASAGVLLHEANHLLRDHIARHDEHHAHDPGLWNIAADAEINDDLLAARIELPGTPVTPELLGRPRGLLAEQYFDHLRSVGSDVDVRCGSGAGGKPLPDELDDDDGGVGRAEQQLVRRRVATDIADAHNVGKTAPPRVCCVGRTTRFTPHRCLGRCCCVPLCDERSANVPAKPTTATTVRADAGSRGWSRPRWWSRIPAS